MSTERVEARLRLIALIQEWPLDVDLEVDVKWLSREEFNGLPGRRECSFGVEKRFWTKDVSDEGVIVTYYTRELPLTDWDEVARGESLRVIPGGQGVKSLLVAAYLAAIVAANLSVAHWGASAAIYNAFLFIGLDLTTRDRLHDLWHGHLLRNMATLIVAGSALSYALGQVLNSGPFVGRIALASCVAFGAAATADALAYHLLRHRSWYERANQSNIAGAAVDSLVFVALWPFGFQFTLAFTLFAAKVAGGVVWAFLLRETPSKTWMRRNRELYGRAS